MALLPSHTTWLAVVAALFLSAIVYSYVRSFRTLRHIPGPKLCAWTGIPLIWKSIAGHANTEFGRLAEEYGPLVRIGPNQLLTSDPEVWRAVNAARSPYRRSDFFQAMRLHPGRDNVLSHRSEEKHDELRRKMAAGYSGKENPRLEQSIDNRVRDFIDLIERKYISTKDAYRPMDLAQKVQYFTIDVITDLAFNSSFNDLKDDNDNHHYLKDMVANVPVFVTLCLLPRLHQFLERSQIMNMMLPSVKARTGLGRVIALAVETVASRFDNDGKVKDQDDMLGSFLRHGLTKDEAESEVVFQLIAGSDTTAGGLRSCLLQILSNPRVYARLMSEIDQGVKAGLIPPPETGEIISDENSKKMPYLQACIKEALRHRPPVSGLLSKAVPEGGREISGYFVPGGTRLGYCALGIHHNTAIFGSDVKVFRPERWLLESQGGTCASAAELAKLERNQELIFANGRFQCLGKNVAQLELNKLSLELLRRFDFTVENTARPWKSVCYGILIDQDFLVRVERRGEKKESV